MSDEPLHKRLEKMEKSIRQAKIVALSPEGKAKHILNNLADGYWNRRYQKDLGCI